ncbi:response regulator, partial [Aegicerativicinus sediminis]
KKPDVIVCDIIMPYLSGYDVLEQLTNDDTTKFIPFIFLSAKTEKNDIRKGMNLGADDYITKPFTEDELLTAIESRIAKSELLREKSIGNALISTEGIKTLEELKSLIEEEGTIFKYNKNDVIFNENQHPNYVYLIKKGVVKCHKINDQGKELITGLHKENDLFGISAFDHHSMYQETATAIKDLEIVGISRDELKNILEKNHEVMFQFIQLVADNLDNLKDQLLQMAYSSVNKKTASTILRFAKKINKNLDDPIKISRHDLASVAGISSETFIRSMAEFKKQGAIKIDGRDIKLLDIEKLKTFCHD